MDNDYRGVFTVNCYLQGASPICNPYTCITPFDEAIAQEVGCSNWKDRIVVDEVRSNLFNRMKTSSKGWVLVDILTVVNGLFVFQDDFIKKYYSPYAQLYRLEHPKLSHVGFRNVDSDVLKRLFFTFMSKLTEVVSSNRIILVKAIFPCYKKMQYGDAIPIEGNNENNDLLYALYSYWDEFFCDKEQPVVIDLSEYCIQKINANRCDQGEYVDILYKVAIEQIYSAVTGNSTRIYVSGKSLLKKSKIALIKDEFNNRCPIESLGNNTGNVAFWTSIEKMFNPDQVPHSLLNSDIFDDYDRIILTDLIWIREKIDYSYLLPLVNKYYDKIVVMSIGLQSAVEKQSFELHPSVVEILTKLSSCNPLGLRGKYTEQILKQYGIENVQIIGCPSMYYWCDPNFAIDAVASSKKVVANYRAFYGRTSDSEVNLLKIFMDSHARFIEQNKIDYRSSVHIPDVPHLREYLTEKSEIYYSDYGWQRGISDCTYSVGMRFHGNVFALRRGIPALFIYSDTRTKELTDYFSLPAVSIDSITSETKIDDLIQKTDYKEFNARYPWCYNNFLEFIKKCGLVLVDEWGRD